MTNNIVEVKMFSVKIRFKPNKPARMKSYKAHI